MHFNNTAKHVNNNQQMRQRYESNSRPPALIPFEIKLFSSYMKNLMAVNSLQAQLGADISGVLTVMTLGM